MFKHMHALPSVMVVFFELEWNDPYWSRMESECAAHLTAVRKSLEGRLCKLVVVLLHQITYLKDDPQADVRAISFRRACEVEGKNSLFILPVNEKEKNPDVFQGYVNRLDSVFKDLASAAIDEQAGRIRSHRVPAGAPGYSVYTIRHQFKLAFFNETLSRSHEAIRHYSSAYSELLTLRQSRSQSMTHVQKNEIKAMAGLINHRSCSLQLVLNHWKAIELFRRHLSHFKEVPTLATPHANMSAAISDSIVDSFRHLSWISRQYQVFGELFLQAVSIGAVQADQSHHPGFYLRQAAVVAIKRHSCYRQIVDTDLASASLYRLASIDRDGSENKPANTFVGQEMIQVLGQAAQMQEADFVNEVVELLAQARIQYKRFKCARMTRCIAVQIADQYLRAQLYERAFLVYEKVHVEYRRDGWDVLVDIVLRSSLVCACALGRLDRAMQLALECSSRTFNGSHAERDACLRLARALGDINVQKGVDSSTSAENLLIPTTSSDLTLMSPADSSLEWIITKASHTARSSGNKSDSPAMASSDELLDSTNVLSMDKPASTPALRIAMSECLPIINCSVCIQSPTYTIVDEVCVSVNVVSNLPQTIKLASLSIAMTEATLNERSTIHHQDTPLSAVVDTSALSAEPVVCTVSANERTYADLTLTPEVPRTYTLIMGATGGAAGSRLLEVSRVELTLDLLDVPKVAGEQADTHFAGLVPRLVFDQPRILHADNGLGSGANPGKNAIALDLPATSQRRSISGSANTLVNSTTGSLGADSTVDYSRRRIGLICDERDRRRGVEIDVLNSHSEALSIFHNERWSARLTPRPSQMKVRLVHRESNSNDVDITFTSDADVPEKEMPVPGHMLEAAISSHLNIKKPTTPRSTPDNLSLENLAHEDALAVDVTLARSKSTARTVSNRKYMGLGSDGFGRMVELDSITAVTGEVSPILIQVTNHEDDMVTDLRIELWESTRDLSASPNALARRASIELFRGGLLSWSADAISANGSDGSVQSEIMHGDNQNADNYTLTHTLEKPLPELLSGVTHDLSFFLHNLTDVDERALAVRLSYMCQGVATVSELSFPLTVIEPFEWQAKVAHQFRPVREDAVASGDTFMVMVDAISKIPFEIDVLSTELQLSSDIEMAQGTSHVSRKDFNLYCEHAWSECLYLRCNLDLPVGHSKVVDVGEMLIHWKSTKENRRGSSVILLPSVVIERQPLVLETDIASVGFLNTPLTVTHRLFNKSNRVQHVAFTMEASDSFMFSGYKYSKVRVLPMSSQSHTYQLCPLACGLIALPKLSLHSISDDVTISFATGNVATHLYVKPTEHVQ
ncbi:hypothetical protein SARC_02380 [Sphaeroforma arctica JP610]|uniref:Trafficking protein particle complex subunit 11 domain-containing protein n=1 Tax=Sphaeroforma arctica JP610 TaxID=667725 RepID=A0A0L0G8V0_9EUKA|nr:hypothetical protein SARC_02380 [Sphaeroforma arctica JP610]KNC85430.1 hypothetical protein SARC_02380 [Sphaeroforma arctica JP610]|eukprot:XP_014159332.1 hypothetical protein SARC_02380 [Sphaeroforma arctica JP610]